jgi:hypothetical protein
VTHPVDEQDDARADEEVVDAVPVPVPERAPFTPTSVPASTAAGGALVPAGPTPVQAAAVAMTGFAAGAATVAVVRRRRARKAAKRTRPGRKERKALGEVRATRSFLVDIHLLGGRD